MANIWVLLRNVLRNLLFGGDQFSTQPSQSDTGKGDDNTQRFSARKPLRTWQ
ncbi:MAG: hypothetical protein ACR5K7_00575 [Symbiopectobacterium sp.]